ncbi:YqcI/YcgG family protein [Paenibacillus alginolyticus]|uniref:YqcI/YcgG family protein n=1 Tax=Paenibacillus alginolyticus TaxID=59839 RepID=A0ABT4GL70_9BACL|nr:YqcI/YcgG family protein [Paenibacillus alginolyticus]MCY9696945.1 YqcI/YcgG family protein [Paenibacillus alginolyticus]MEC0145789.1 YqcI/YcgG family protein [Paenibacillus alginolyticus]
MVNLISKDWIEDHQVDLPEWQQDAFCKFGQMINDPDQMYPCIPGRLGYISNSLRFGFAADPRSEEAIKNVAKLLQQYGDCSRETGKYASLVIFFNTPDELANGFSIDNYEQLFWSILSRVSAIDQAPWPSHISSDPSHPSWEFCFDGHPYFVFCGTPAHEIRKSRRTPCFLITFQPRWVFEEINDSTPFGRNMKKLIRQKLVEYDGVPAHPSLKWYGQSDNLEWEQYFLRDDESVASKCPFASMIDKV